MDYRELSDWKMRLITKKNEIIEKHQGFKERERIEYMGLMDEWAKYRIEQEEWMKEYRSAKESGSGVDGSEPLDDIGEIELTLDSATEDEISKYMRRQT
ncbi:MAG: hypothetical protein FWG12_02715 [Holophagaceae bacterium]|nr:hypothetical protein [Holophagaceae bacterium]